MKSALLTFSSMLLWAVSLQAQELIPLSEEDIARLGIIFAPVASPDRQSGSRFPGTVIHSPESISEVTVPVQSILERWHVMPGDQVEEGQLLASLHSQEVLELQNRWLSGSAEKEHAELMLAKDTQLYEKGIISRQRLLETEHELEQASIELIGVAGSLGRVGFDENALARLAGQPALMGSYNLYAPLQGVVTARSITVGMTAERFQPLATLAGDSPLWLRASVPARYARDLLPGMELSLAGLSATVSIRYRDLAVHETTQTLEVLAEINSAGGLLPGQVLGLILPAPDEGILVPGAAVVHSGDDTVVYVETSGGVEARVLELMPNGSNYVAHRGLVTGDQVVIQGAALLKGVQLGLGQDE